MAKKIQELDVVALLRNMPEEGLIKGQVGTVVDQLSESVYEVEFCDDNGKAYAMLGIPEKDLIVLHYSQAEAA